MSRRRRVVESSDEDYSEASEIEEIISSPLRRRSNRIRRMSNESNENDSDSDSEQEMINNSNNHNRNHNHNSNNNNSQFQSQLYDEAKQMIEDSNSDSSDNENDNTNLDNDPEPQNTHPNYSSILPRFIATLDKKFNALDDEITETAIDHLIDTATSIAEYNNKSNNYKKQTENLQQSLNKLLNASKDIKIEKLMLRRISNDIREEKDLFDENNENPIETGTWNSYLNSERNKTLNNINNNRMNDYNSEAVKKFINTDMDNYKYQFKEAIQVEDIEEFDNNIDSSDDDIVIDRRQNKSKGKITCPLTTSVFKQPFKSKICGHTFEKDAVFKYIGDKERLGEVVECPLVGCGKVLSKDNMVRDVRMEKLIKQKNKEEQNEDSEEDIPFDLTVPQ